MDGRKFQLHDGKKGAALAIRVTPRADHDEIVEILGDGTLKVHLTDGSSEKNTNEHLIKFLAEKLNVSALQLEIVAGSKGRDKLISVLDLEADVLNTKVRALIN